MPRNALANFPLALLGLLLLAEGAGEAFAERPPNVLLIVADDLNDAIRGYGGHRQAYTPNLDRLAEESVRFSSAHSNNPVCGPSRASFLTGIYPHASGYYGYEQGNNRWNRNPVLSRATTIFEHFSASGYDVYATGKLFHHLTPEVYVRDDGFDGYSHLPWDFGPWAHDGEKRVAHPKAPGIFRRGAWPAFMSYSSLAEVPMLKANQEKGIPGYRGWVRGDGSPFRYEGPNDRDLMPDEEHARWAAELIGEEREKPFFIAVGFHRPHAPWYAPEKHFKSHPLEKIELPPYRKGDLDDTPAILRRHSDAAMIDAMGRFPRLRASFVEEEDFVAEWKKWIRAYLACVSFVDEQVGVVLDALRNSPHAKDTIVVVTSDHGYHMGEKDRLWKRSLWEESTRVPLYISSPGVSRDGKTCAKPVSLIDLFPTLIDLAGAPARPNEGMPFSLGGHSLRPLLEDPETGTWSGPDVALSVIDGGVDPGRDRPGKIEDQHFSVRSERYRYVRTADGEEEMYDHLADPQEWSNLAQEPGYQMAKRKLRKSMDQLLSQ